MTGHVPEESEPDLVDRAATRRARTALCAAILAAGGIGLFFSVQEHETDAAMVFVGLPTLLALAVALSPPARSVHGLTFKAVSISLLCAAVMLHEGAICVLFAAPLVFAVAHTVVAIVNRSNRRAFAVVPLALLLGAEGLTPGLRVAPEQSVVVSREVQLTTSQVAARVAAGPAVGATPRSILLANLPLPQHAAGAGLEPGDRWAFHFHGDSHGPGGELVTEVTAHSRGPAGESVEFRTVSDTSIVARWLDWRSARVEWHDTGHGTQVTLTARFIRGLDPSWYFGPLEQGLVDASATFLLDAMGLPG